MRYQARLIFPLAVALSSLTTARADMIFTGTFSGTNENPSTGSPATGFVSLDIIGDSMTMHLNFTGLVGGVAEVANIHCCTPVGTNTATAVAFGAGFPFGVTSGAYVNPSPFDLTLLTTYIGSFVTANGGTAASAEAALIAGLQAGQAYANISTAQYPGGEIRANLALQPDTSAAPELSTSIMVAAGMAGLFAWRRSHKLSN
jgi:CHRD domain